MASDMSHRRKEKEGQSSVVTFYSCCHLCFHLWVCILLVLYCPLRKKNCYKDMIMTYEPLSKSQIGVF